MKEEYRKIISLVMIFLGVIILIASLILAISYKYNRFYSFLLVGLFMILKEGYRLLKNKELMSLRVFTFLYFGVFLIFGIFGDLIFGLWICKLWSYPSYTLINYLNLYLLIYPLGGMVMVYSFALLEKLSGIKVKENKATYKVSIRVSLILWLVGLVFLVLCFFTMPTYVGFFIYLFAGISAIGLMSYLTLLIRKDDLLERLFIKPIKYLILIIIVAYTQGFLHEYPNVFVKEWIYHNFPYENITFLGIPVTVLFFGWIALVVGPYMIFEFAKALCRLNSPKELLALLIGKNSKKRIR